MSQLKAILFDLDDTLIDWTDFNAQWEASERSYLRGVFEYLQRNVHPVRDFDAFCQEYFSRTREAWSYARSTLRAPHLGRVLTETAMVHGVPQDKLQTEMLLKHYRWDAAPGVKVFADVPPMLRRLQQRGIKVGIVTNAYQPMSVRDVELRTFGLLDYFPSCRFSAADVGYLKPHPIIFQTALKCLGTKPEETVFIGDNPVADIAGAQSAGMYTILRVKQPLRPMLSGLVIPDAAVNNFDELPAQLDMLYPGWENGAA